MRYKNVKKGFFSPVNPDKYIGDPKNIVYRSGLEKRYMKYFDNHPEIIKWASEEFFIPYRSPFTNRTHRYFIDFYIKKKDGLEYIIEIKPSGKLKKPKKKGKWWRENMVEYVINQCKFKAAKEYAKAHGLVFEIMTEKDI